MALFDRPARHLARGPAVLFPTDPAASMAGAMARYDPAATVKHGRFACRNGVRLAGPAAVTPQAARKTGLPDGLSVGYYATTTGTAARWARPDHLKWQDAERLVRGLAARLGGTVHDQRPPMRLQLRVSVYSGQPSPPEEVAGVLQPYVDTGDLFTEEDPETVGAYYLLTGQEQVFLVVYWPPRLSRSPRALPPPALGALATGEPCRWDLRTTLPVDTAARETCLTVGEAALALAHHTSGTAIDTYGFPVDRPEDLLPR